ncbi:predicted protein [Sclerotinia sclerotiorum 1980 UF-70]|uniref:Uncharacterized protein n=1 Tax=Sclerotinia sclerotiorum (strain ATCC 18683 / 1980 / Ss-1) TaxID=665079 RepID=A7E5W6_SCLS1|nr:predicted protein [Sclerotinia sclerotiorum 1980 UF-70]EDN91288.1 predicted protein [Sclerotinia sclerotiorum 1980 UF-70]
MAPLLLLHMQMQCFIVMLWKYFRTWRKRVLAIQDWIHEIPLQSIITCLFTLLATDFLFIEYLNIEILNAEKQNAWSRNPGTEGPILYSLESDMVLPADLVQSSTVLQYFRHPATFTRAFKTQTLFRSRRGRNPQAIALVLSRYRSARIVH